MKEMKTLKFPNQDEPYEIVDAYAREQLPALITVTQIDGVFSADKTYDKLVALIQENNHVYCLYNERYFNLMVSNDSWTVFNIFDSTGTILDFEWIIFRPEGTVSVTSSSQDLGSIITEAKAYTDQVKSEIYGGAPVETLDTLTELATAFQENEEVVDVLNQAITTKYSADNPPPYPVTSVDGLTGAVVLPSEIWTFTLSDGSTVTKTVVVK